MTDRQSVMTPDIAKLVEELRLSIATASNDDFSKAGTPERRRHTARVVAMAAAISGLEAQAREMEKLASLVKFWIDDSKSAHEANAAQARELAEARARASQNATALNQFQDEVWSSFGKWSEALGWGLSGIQPECFAMMDASVRELVAARLRIADLEDAVRPFGNVFADGEPIGPGHIEQLIAKHVTRQDLLRARAALSRQQEASSNE